MNRFLLFLLMGSVLVFSMFAFADDPGVLITTDTNYRYIISNGIPAHGHGQFPNPGNPNAISAQQYHFRVPLQPQLSGRVMPLENREDFGVAVDGVPFDPGTAEYWNDDRSSGWNYEALSGKIDLGLDENNAHVQPSGAYHYHGIPTALAGADPSHHSPLVGYASDGFPVYALYGYTDPSSSASAIKELHSSYRLKQGTRSSGPGGTYDGSFVQDYEYVEGTGDLDECNGRSGPTPEYLQGTYYYVLTKEFPFVPRCHKGTPDESFAKEHEHQGPGGRLGKDGQPAQGNGVNREQGNGRRTPPPEALTACNGKSDGESCAFDAPMGRISGVCRMVPEGQSACVLAKRP